MKKNIIANNFVGNNAGFIISRGSKYITIEYLTRWTGYYDKTYRVTIAEWEATPGEDAIDKAMYVDQISGIKPVKKSKVY